MYFMEMLLALFLLGAVSTPTFADNEKAAKEGFQEVHEGMKKVTKALTSKARKDLKTVDKRAKKIWKKADKKAKQAIKD